MELLFAGVLDGVAPDQAFFGAGATRTLVGGIVFYSLVFTIVGLILSAGLWAVGAFSNNYTQSVNGKKGFLICAGAALAIGAAFLLVNYFYGLGTAPGGDTDGTVNG